MPRLILFFVCSLLTPLAGGQPPGPVEERALVNVSFDAVLALNTLNTWEPDLRLSYGEDPLQFGWLWLPLRERPDPALIVFIHGGCWLNEYAVDHSFALAGALAERGFAVWSIEYRRSGDPGGGWPGSLEDILAALKYRQHLSAYDLQSYPFAILGHSAGGHLALLAGARLAQQETNLAMVAALAGISDLVSYGRGDGDCEQAVSRFMGGDADNLAANYQQASPARQTLHPRTWVFHGGADSIVPLSQANLNGTILRVLPEAGHFDWIHPGSAAFQLLLASLELAL